MENLGFLEKTVKLVDRYGWKKVLGAILMIAVFLFFIYYIPASIKVASEEAALKAIKITNQQKEEEHINDIEKRRKIQPQIDATLKSLLISTKADRAFIIELHNGSNNVNGIPFLHGSVTYEKSVDGLEMIDEEYQNLSLSRFEMATYMHENFDFIGSIEKMKTIDKKIASKLGANDVKYIAVSTLHNGKNEWGWFGVMYNRDTDLPTEKELLNKMMITSQIIIKEFNGIKND
jgi:hypothetical protein